MRLNQKQALFIAREAYRVCNGALNGKILDAYLYGSYARGDYHKESDIDIFLVADIEDRELRQLRDEIAEIGSNLSLKYDVTISVVVKAAKQFEQYKGVLPYYQNVLREGVTIPAKEMATTS